MTCKHCTLYAHTVNAGLMEIKELQAQLEEERGKRREAYRRVWLVSVCLLVIVMAWGMTYGQG